MENERSYKEYWDSVRSFAQELLDEYQVKTQADYEKHRDDISDRLWETVDGTSWIIYTANAEAVMHHTDNEDAILDVGFDGSSVKCWSDVVTQFAFYAMQQDLQDELARLVEALPEEAGEDEEAQS